MAQSTTADSLEERVQDERIIDGDFHLNPKFEDVIDYMDDPVVQEKFEMSGHPPKANYMYAGYATEGMDYGLLSQGVARDGEDILEAREDVNTDVPVVTPGHNQMPTIQYPVLKTAFARAYNDYVLDRVTPVDDDVKAMLMLPQWDPEAAVEELDRVGDEKDFVAAYGWVGFNEPLGNPKFDPVFEKLVELDLPLTLHAAGPTFPKQSPIGREMRTWTEEFGLGTGATAIMNTGNMIVRGVFDKFPDLDVVYQEIGLSWIPFASLRLDEFYQDHPEDLCIDERMYAEDKKYLDRLPSEYIRDNFYFCTQPICLPSNSRHLKALLEMCYADETFVFSSDWPHHTFDVPEWAFRNPIDDDMRERIFRTNAEEVFRL